MLGAINVTPPLFYISSRPTSPHMNPLSLTWLQSEACYFDEGAGALIITGPSGIKIVRRRMHNTACDEAASAKDREMFTLQAFENGTLPDSLGDLKE
jgi:hypothetical protein